MRTLTLARRIPTVKVGNASVLDAKGFAQLQAAFKELDREAEARGMVFGASAAVAAK